MKKQELLDMMILERIQDLLSQIKEDSAKQKESLRIMEQAEDVFNQLSDQEYHLVEQYLNSMSDRMAEEEPVLYIGDFKDGIKERAPTAF